ncbi:DUF6160 family protein [Alcanivorax sp.]|uniref:putative pilus system protein FilA n=1 Tax=Alcanivorax sp. TaxID=1872427 RepID=UPI002601FE69|nr:DUF6160 family protein [Alcanivorax sp.]
MEFKKLALAAAVAALPATGFSMEALEDSALSGVTGQDGISIAINTNLAASLIVHDTDGIPTGVTAGHGSAGALVMDDFQINTGGNNITLDIDAGDSAVGGTAPVLNVEVGIPNATVITLGSVDIANSNREGAAGDPWGVDATNRVNDVLNLGSITLGATTLNIQLANEPQGDMIALNTTITNGVSISNFALNDAGGTVNGGGISVDSLSVVDSGGANLSVDAGINVSATGLVVRVDQLGDATNGADVRLAGVTLGDSATAPSLGDVELVGLNLNNTVVTISGK